MRNAFVVALTLFVALSAPGQSADQAKSNLSPPAKAFDDVIFPGRDI